MRFKYYLRGAGIGVIAATLILSIAFLFHDNISDEEVIRRAMKLGMVMQENSGGTLNDNAAPGISSTDLEGGEADADPLTEPPDPNGGDNAATDPNTPSEGGDGQASDPGSEGSQNQPDTNNNENQDSQNDNSGKKDTDNKNDNKPADDKSSDNKPADDKSSDNKPADDKSSDDKPSDDKTSDNKNKPSTNKPSNNQPDNHSDEVEIVIESGDVSRMVSAKVFEAGLVDSADEFNSFLGDNDYDNMLQPGTYKIKKGSSFRQIAQILTRQ